MHKRSRKNTLPISGEVNRMLENSAAEVSPSSRESVENDNEKWLRQKALSEALENLNQKCRELLETELDSDKSLKDLQGELGFVSYQAVVQAKYNCKKKLVKEVFTVLNKLKNQESTHGK